MNLYNTGTTKCNGLEHFQWLCNIIDIIYPQHQTRGMIAISNTVLLVYYPNYSLHCNPKYCVWGVSKGTRTIFCLKNPTNHRSLLFLCCGMWYLRIDKTPQAKLTNTVTKGYAELGKKRVGGFYYSNSS